MDHLDLQDDQKEKLRQYTEFTHQQDYDVAVGTLASLNWNLEQAIEAHLMQEDMNDDDDDPEILEAVPPPTALSQQLSGTSSSANGRRGNADVIDIESDEMPASRGRRRGRAAAPDETTMVDNQVKRLRINDDQEENAARTSKRGGAVPRQGRRNEQASSSSSSSTSLTQTRRHTRAHPAVLHQEPAQPESARDNGTSTSARSQRDAIVYHNQRQQDVVATPIQVDDSDEEEDMMNIGYDDDILEPQNHHNGQVDNNEVVPRGNSLPNGRVPMIPEEYSSVQDGLRNFVTVFSERFCSTPATQAFMPPFYTDTLPNALKEAFENPNVELRRPFVFYINHDRSIASNIFASQVLCSEAVSSLIRHQYILFPWDISSDMNLMHFMEFLQTSNMADVRNLVQRMAMSKVETFPMMIIITRERNAYRLVDICRGTDTADQVLEKLLSGVEEYSNIRMNEASERREREEREAIRNQQEAEYEASLAADKARIEAKKREIEEQRLEEERKQREIEDEAVRRQIVASTLPEEPPANASAAEIINVKFRLPEGGQDMRRFRRDETIQTLIDYLSSKGFSPEKYKYFNSDFPKKEITRHFDLSKNFTESKWPGREQIFVEEI